MSRALIDIGVTWRAAAVMGLISSTYSTIVSQLMAGRIGRDALVDWMIVGSIALREHGLQTEPTWWTVLAGILVHQAADFSWDMVFFFLLSRWSNRLGPWALMGVALPWAIFTSGIEWMFFVPVIPFWWPVFTLEQAWWLGLVVHITAASTYPLFPFIRDWMAGIRLSPHRRFARVWASLGVLGVAVLGIAAFAGEQDREFAHVGDRVAFDQTYMVNMSAHHRQGIELASLAVEQAADPHLRALARLMIATQNSEIRIFRKWWRSWFGGELPMPSPELHAQMPGMLSGEQLAQVAKASGAQFDSLFVALMSFHHHGAITMADAAIAEAGDPRLKLMSHGIKHQQQGDINLMHGVDGFAAVRSAARAMFHSDAAPYPAEAPSPGTGHAHP